MKPNWPRFDPKKCQNKIIYMQWGRSLTSRCQLRISVQVKKLFSYKITYYKKIGAIWPQSNDVT